MPSRKQRRRRQKERRHDYEYVYVDEEGRDLDEPPEAEPRAPRDGKKGRDARAGRRSTRGRAIREQRPPSWTRSGRRALIFCPLFFLVFSLVNSRATVEARLLMSVLYSALFVPLTYFMDRTAYRTYVRRSGGDAAVKRR